MSTKAERMNKFMRHCRDKFGRDVTTHEVALEAKAMGWKMPVPKDPVDILAQEFSDCARSEIRYDEETGEQFHPNVSYPEKQGDQQLTFWGDIDRVKRPKMHKNYIYRREQSVADCVSSEYDVRRWNRKNPDEEPIVTDFDLAFDVQLRINSPKGSKGNKDAA